MGFLSKVRKRIKKQIRPNNMMIGNIRNMPKRPNILGRGSLGDSFLFGKRPRGNLGSDFRMPQIGGILREGKKRRGGFGFGLGEAIRRLKEQGDMGMPSMIAGGTPGFYDNMRENMSPGQRLGQMPQPIPRAERMPSFNPTIFGQPIGDMDFSQMPKISPEDMMNLQVPTQMPMTQDLPEVAPVGMMPQMRMSGMQDMQPRMMMQAGDEVSFPDLTGDGKVTQADILKGRGVYAEGDEVMMMEETEMMAPGGDEIEASLMEVQGMQPETQMLDQYVQMVIEMVQAGASEAEVIESLRQAGLDDDDIAAVFQAVMETLQGSMEQGGIDAELAQLS